MNFSNPFSGLSLIVHVGIIILAPLLRPLLASRLVKAMSVRMASSSLAVMIVAVIAVTVTSSSIIAIKTGLTTGESLIHMAAVRVIDGSTAIAAAAESDKVADTEPQNTEAYLFTSQLQSFLPLSR